MEIRGNGNIIINSNNNSQKKRKKKPSKIIMIIAALATILGVMLAFFDKYQDYKETQLKKKNRDVMITRSVKPN